LTRLIIYCTLSIKQVLSERAKLMQIQFRLRGLMAEKERETGQPCTYDSIREATGISPNTLSRIANNKVKMVGISVLARLLEYFECEPNDLIVVVEQD
jgi:DNA-binding Xre family transcriptional regulator